RPGPRLEGGGGVLPRAARPSAVLLGHSGIADDRHADPFARLAAAELVDPERTAKISFIFSETDFRGRRGPRGRGAGKRPPDSRARPRGPCRRAAACC